ncbi:unnamed protein product [Staurois parvus]|uniref:Uncharacterized protein n=1 Tax=Staurois parvus TaxID=386267 RepID=A0ABN9HNN9_9NEOB|nr:unnamed protein product [Staurois parvus]
MGPCTASSCCCQARNLPWAPVPNSSSLLPRPVICHGPCTASSSASQVQSVSWSPCKRLPLLLTPPSPHSDHVPLHQSPHTAGVPFLS